MKKKFMMLSCIAAVAIATIVGKKTLESHAYETNNLLMQNVEALATGTDDDWSDCPRDKWIRNAKESWSSQTAQYEAGFGFYITINGKKRKLGAGAEVGGTVYVPTCPNSSGNCCEKKHLDKPFRYA